MKRSKACGHRTWLKREFFSFLMALAVTGGCGAASAATIEVTSSSDGLTDGARCTLRGAVDAINGGNNANGCSATGVNYGTDDTIVFADALAGQTVLFTQAITIEKALTIRGPASAATTPANRVTLKGGGSTGDFRLLDVVDTVNPSDPYAPTLVVEDLNLIEAHVKTGAPTRNGSGAAIRSDSGDIFVFRCTFSDNVSFALGGAIEAGFGTVTIIDSLFENNTGINGGAIDTDGLVIVDTSSFIGNQAASGGALYANKVFVANSTFSDNQAVGGDGSSSGVGGAIRAYYVTASASTFHKNQAILKGGAVRAWASLIGRHLTFVNNTSPSGAAIFLERQSAELANSLIVGNSNNASCAGNGTFTGRHNLVAYTPSSSLVDDDSCGGPPAVPIGGTASVAAVVDTALGDHGGPTKTLALPAGSLALGAADKDASASSTSLMLDSAELAKGNIVWIDATADQRGERRKAIDAGRDVGAFEGLSAPTPPPSGASAIPVLSPAVLALLASALGFTAWRKRQK